MRRENEGPEEPETLVGASFEEAAEFYAITKPVVTPQDDAQYIPIFTSSTESFRGLRAALGYVTRITLAHPSIANEYASTFVESVFEKVGPLYPALWTLFAGTRRVTYYDVGDVSATRYAGLNDDLFDLTFSSIYRLENISARQASIHSYIGLLWDFGRQFADLVSRFERRRTPWGDKVAAPEKSKPSVFATEESDERLPWTRQARPPRSHLDALAFVA
jgi:hypothetical protein